MKYIKNLIKNFFLKKRAANHIFPPLKMFPGWCLICVCCCLEGQQGMHRRGWTQLQNPAEKPRERQSSNTGSLALQTALFNRIRSLSQLCYAVPRARRGLIIGGALLQRERRHKTLWAKDESCCFKSCLFYMQKIKLIMFTFTWE